MRSTIPLDYINDRDTMIKDPLDYDIKVYFYVRHLHTPIEKGKDPTFVEGNIRNTVEDV